MALTWSRLQLVVLLLAALPKTASAQVQLGDGAFAVVLDVSFGAAEAKLPAKTRENCRVVRLPRLEDIVQRCGGKVLRPAFYGSAMSYRVRIPDSSRQACGENLRKELPFLRITEQPRTAPERRIEGNWIAGHVMVQVDASLPREQARAIIEKHGGQAELAGGAGLWRAHVPYGCEEAYLRTIGKDSAVKGAYRAVTGKPR